MAESKVIIPLNASDDDFLAFSFCGKNSRQDFNLWRTSEGSRYNNNLAPTMNDKTAEIQGSDGVHFFRTEHKQKDFVINFAFDKLSEKQVREMKKWLSGKEMGDLWFAEEPYKVYTAKVTGQPNIKTLCFDVNGKRVYRGEGSVQFTAYWPYAHTPDNVYQQVEDGEPTKIGSGKVISSYSNFPTSEQWKETAGLVEDSNKVCKGENPGDIPAFFVMEIEAKGGETVYENIDKIVVDDYTIIPSAKCSKIKWDSRTGLLFKKDGDKEILIPYTGKGLAVIPVGGVDVSKIYYQTENEESTNNYYIDGTKKIINKTGGDPETKKKAHNNITLNYHYWYY